MRQTATIRTIPVMIFILMAALLMSAPAYRGNRATSQLTDLTTIGQLKERIQQDSGKVRLIALLSPV